MIDRIKRGLTFGNKPLRGLSQQSVRVFKGEFSSEILKVVNPRELHLIIDSSHQYPQTNEELDFLDKKVKSNEIICGKDWQPHPKYHQQKSIGHLMTLWGIAKDN